MRLLLTGGNGHFARAAAAALSGEHDVRSLDMAFSPALQQGIEAREGDVRDPAFAAACVDGVDAILHLAPLTMFDPQEVDDASALDIATRGTFVLLNAAREAGVQHIILASTLDLFDRMPTHWRVSEAWKPRPMPSTPQLCAWLAELSARENARAGGLEVICLRFGRIVNDTQAASQPFDPRWVHVDDAIEGVHRAIVGPAVSRSPAALPGSQGRANSHPAGAYIVRHITAAGSRAKVRMANSASGGDDFGYQRAHDFHERWPEALPERDERPWEEVLAPLHMPSRPIRNVVIFGAGGPVAAVTARELASSYALRLADIRAVADVIAEGKPQMPGAPLPTLLGAPHEYQIVDVRDPQQVLDACEGMDAIINLSVLRQDPADAFRVNTLGAINVMRAAVAHGIRRVVHTGPLVSGTHGPGDYQSDYDLHADAPARPYNALYIHSKYLAQEACRVFAEHYGLEVPALLFNGFVNPERPGGPNLTFAVSWEDSARAIRRALEVPSLPSPYEEFNVLTDLPQRRYRNEKTKEILGWVPRDRLEHFWKEAQS
jgi:nucleoside-diphosphate-sugar epimerase